MKTDPKPEERTAEVNGRGRATVTVLHHRPDAVVAVSDEAGLDLVFLTFGGKSRADDLRAALVAQGVTIAHEQTVTLGSAEGIAALARAIAGQPGPGLPAPREDVVTGIGSNAVLRRPVALIPDDLLVNGTALGSVLDDPRLRTAALAGADNALLDVLRIDAADRPAVSGLVHELDPTEPEKLLLELVRRLPGAGVTVHPVPIGGYAWARPTTEAETRSAERALAAVPERRVRLREAARVPAFGLRRLSWRLTDIAERIGLTPNQVTIGSFVLGLLAAVLIATGDRMPMVAGALLLQLGVVVDGVDGELTRYRRRFSRLGAWLEAATGRIKEFAVVFGLAVAGARADQDLWPLAALAIALQTFRSLVEESWALRRQQLDPASSPLWIAPAERVRFPPGRVSATSWLKRIGPFPVGERFLVISLGAALWTPKATLIALCVCGLAASVYLLTRRGQALGGDLVPKVVADSGPWLGAVLQTFRGRSAVIAPAVVAVAELAVVYLLSASVQAEHGAAVLLVAVIAVAHAMHGYSVREGVSDPALPLLIGTDLRMVAFAVLIFVPGLLLPITPQDWVTGGLWALTGVVAATSAGTSLRSWISVGR